MSIRCKLGFHKWNNKIVPSGDVYLDLLFANIIRYCERCERIEKGTIIFGSFLPPYWEKVGSVKKELVG